MSETLELKAENESKEKDGLISAFSTVTEKAFARLTVSTTIVADEGRRELLNTRYFGLFISLCALFSDFSPSIYIPLWEDVLEFRVCFLSIPVRGNCLPRQHIKIKGFPIFEKGATSVSHTFGKLTIEQTFWYSTIVHSVNMTKPS